MHNDPPHIPRSIGGIQYRLYFFNGATHIEKVHEFEANDDADGIRISEGWREGRRMELWQLGRVVKRWD